MPLRVLIVEDDPVMAFHIRSILEDAGHKVVGVAQSTAQAMSLALGQRPHVALVDLMLRHEPEGLDIALELSSRFKIRILFVTGSDGYEDLARERAPNLLGFVVKPFEAKDILEPLRTLRYPSRHGGGQMRWIGWVIMTCLALSGCGTGGMSRSVVAASNTFDRGACLSEQLKTGKPCDQRQFEID